jgi:hypothetical protein
VRATACYTLTTLHRAAFTAGHAADFRARRKRARAPATDAAFVPLVQETYERVHHEAYSFLKDLVSRAYPYNGTWAIALRVCRMRLAVALCKGNGLVFCMMAQNLARATGQACLGGARVPFVDDSDDCEP